MKMNHDAPKFDVLPEGEYPAQVFGVTDQTSAKGNPYWSFAIELVGQKRNDGKPLMVYGSAFPDKDGNMKRPDWFSEDMPTYEDSDEMLNDTYSAVISHREYNNKTYLQLDELKPADFGDPFKDQ